MTNYEKLISNGKEKLIEVLSNDRSANALYAKALFWYCDNICKHREECFDSDLFETECFEKKPPKEIIKLWLESEYEDD